MWATRRSQDPHCLEAAFASLRSLRYPHVRLFPKNRVAASDPLTDGESRGWPTSAATTDLKFVKFKAGCPSSRAFRDMGLLTSSASFGRLPTHSPFPNGVRPESSPPLFLIDSSTPVVQYSRTKLSRQNARGRYGCRQAARENYRAK